MNHGGVEIEILKYLQIAGVSCVKLVFRDTFEEPCVESHWRMVTGELWVRWAWITND